MEQSSGNVYELIGRAVVGYVRRRYRREIRIAAMSGVALATLAAAGIYIATRDDESA
ncbi:MAG: hypothetical protein ACXWW8_07285 [Solirubrobacterales bacterium]